MDNAEADALPATILAQHRMRRRGRWIRTGIVFVSCVLLVDALIGDRGLAGTIKARADYTRLSSEVNRLEAENAGLREQARRLHDDPSMIERVAREDLGLVQRGELLFIVKDVN